MRRWSRRTYKFKISLGRRKKASIDTQCNLPFMQLLFLLFLSVLLFLLFLSVLLFSYNFPPHNFLSLFPLRNGWFSRNVRCSGSSSRGNIYRSTAPPRSVSAISNAHVFFCGIQFISYYTFCSLLRPILCLCTQVSFPTLIFYPLDSNSTYYISLSSISQ